MKTISINVSDPVYHEFQEYAKTHDRTAAELIRQAMAEYRDEHFRERRSVREIHPVSLGRVKKPLSAGDDFLGEMLNEIRD